jgi:peptide/nickel transport system permease protein
VSGLIARKVVHALLVLLIVSFALAFLIDLTPGDPAFSVVTQDSPPEQIAQVHKALHLDDPLLTRYADWLAEVGQGRFGTSFRTGESVGDMILQRLPVTLELIILSLTMTLAISIPIGVYCAYRADGRFDRMWSVATSALISTPPFVSALLLVYVFSLLLRHTFFHFPVTGWVKLSESVPDNLWHAFLPALVLALVEIPAYTRLLRADMIATLQEDYILAARAKGVPTKRILFRHALRPSSFSLITLLALSMGRIVGGAVIVETVFAIPGVGALTVTSITVKDLPVVQGIVMVVAIAYVLINSFTDILYVRIDPRVRRRGA